MIAPIQRGWNETAYPVDQVCASHRPNYSISCHRVTVNAFLLGMTPVGLRCWDASRLVDFLQEQDIVDPKRIGVTGL